jgi:hypothetical protein
MMKQVMSSVSKAELTALNNRCKLAVPICTILEEFGTNSHQ